MSHSLTSLGSGTGGLVRCICGWQGVPNTPQFRYPEQLAACPREQVAINAFEWKQLLKTKLRQRRGNVFIETRTVEESPGRNDLCPCGSGKKFKRCHG